MIHRSRLLCASLPVLVLGICLASAKPDPAKPLSFRAGAAVVDIAPPRFPVRVNGMFTERTADQLVDPLTARALALDDGTNRLVLCVVDTCMMPRDLIDAAKLQASAATGIPTDRMLVSATHTHSAPAAMGCLGSRADPEYAAFLPGKIAEAMVAAVQNLQPARAGWTAFDDWDHTHNRRWIRRPDHILNDPFGQPTVRANMHPGHQSPEVTGPSGPVDPQISMLAVETAGGRPLALLANYSMHYQGSPMLSSDYFGRFAVHVGQLLGADRQFVGMMSQGTSGDLWSGDYSRPAPAAAGYDEYARQIAERVAAAYRKIEWKSEVPLAMAESTLTLDCRIPDGPRMAWARDIEARLGGQLPQSQPEIYALEAVQLHQRRKTELKLQALRIGDLGITGIPNEVFCLTGLKLKARSPFPLTMNIGLANGAEGYIPPPEQHALGGYTTWPARTAGLEVKAEPRITAALESLMEKVAGKPGRRPVPEDNSYAKAVRAAKPAAFWRMEEMDAPVIHDSAGPHQATLEPGAAVFLPGMGEQPRASPASRAVHFAGGRLKADLPLGNAYTVAFWLWNALPAEARAVAGYAYSRGPEGDASAPGEHLGIGGTCHPDSIGRLILFNGNARGDLLSGKTVLAQKAWHHVALVREGSRVRVHLDGQPVPEIEGELPLTAPEGDHPIFMGGRNDNLFNWEGKLDEAAVFPRALPPGEISALYQASGLTPPAATTAAVTSPPLTPEESLGHIHLPAGFKVELAAAEPQVADPVAIDWDLAGRLWVVEMPDYPLGLDGKGKPGGRVRVLEDTDGDGRYEKSTLFADGLNFPTGLLTWRDGVIVTAAPDILLLRDTDGDGRADQTEKLVSGLQEGNQQLRANGLRWGLDNRVYCAAGGHHGEYGANTKLRSHRAGEEVVIGSRDFSFDPDSGGLRAESGPSQFGRNRDDSGHWFGTQNSRALWQYVLPDPYLRRNPHVPAPDPTQLIVTPLNAPVYPASPPEQRFHSYENAGHFTSACSGMIYRDELLFPRRPRELDAFTCEPFHNLVQHNILTEEGVAYISRRASGEEKQDFFASADRWCRPVMARTGPDGALWVVDMYRYIIEHPDWLPEKGRADLLPFYRLGEDKGRIYRVLPESQAGRKAPRLDTMTVPQLLAALASPNEWQRDKAHMALVWKLKAVSNDEKLQWADEFLGAMESPDVLLRLHLLCILEGIGSLPETLVFGGLRDPAPAVREQALRLAETTHNPAIIGAAEALVDDPDPKVRLQLAFSLGAWSVALHPAYATAGAALARLAVRDHADPFLRAAIMSSAQPHCAALCHGIAAAGGPALDAFADNLTTLALALHDRDSLAAMLRPALTPDQGRFRADQMSACTRLLDALKQQQTSPAALSAGKDDLLSKILQQAPAIWRFAQETAADEAAAPLFRAAAAGLMVRFRMEDGEQQLLASWLDPTCDPLLQLAAVRVLSESADQKVPALLLAKFSSLSPGALAAAMEALLGREAWTIALLEMALQGGALPLDAVQRARLARHGSEKVRGLAAKVLAAESPRKEVIEHFLPALQLQGDPGRGRTVFLARCIACHRLDHAGTAIGPDLKSVSSHPPEKLLTNIIDPGHDVQPGYFAYQARLTGGSDLYGLVASETGNSLTFKLTDGSTRLIARKEITELKSTGTSLMPAGLETGLSHQEMADLIASLRAGTLP